MIVIPSERFSYSKEDRTFVTEASTIKDISDINKLRLNGFFIRSGKTGAVAEYAQCSTSFDLEGDVTSWKFAPTAKTLRAMPNLWNTSVIIFND